MSKLKVLDLFAGIGGFTIGLHKTELYETVAFCEWDLSCQKVLNKNFPGLPCFGDITNLTYLEGGVLVDDIEGSTLFTTVDILTGGFPCQDISKIGKGAGLEGERSGYWRHYKRLIGEIKPKGLLIENVSILRSRGLGTILQDLNSLGYDAEWHCIPASFCGAPHERDRIWIIAYRASERVEGLEPFQPFRQTRPGGWGGKAHLQQISNNPFERSGRWPEPLIRREDVRFAGRVDRLKQLGNTVYWPIVEQLGYHLYRNLHAE